MTVNVVECEVQASIVGTVEHEGFPLLDFGPAGGRGRWCVTPERVRVTLTREPDGVMLRSVSVSGKATMVTADGSASDTADGDATVRFADAESTVGGFRSYGEMPDWLHDVVNELNTRLESVLSATD